VYAALGKRSLHFFTMFVLGYDRLSGPGGFHWEVCKRLTNVKKPQFHAYYRGAFKTTMSLARALWRAVQEPETYDHIHIYSDAKLGEARFKEMGRHCERNPVLLRLYPYMAPAAGSWDKTQKTIRGRTKGGPTFELRTVSQPQTGRHVAGIDIDDWVNDANFLSRQAQEELCAKFRALFPTINTDELLIWGTFYADYDVWQYVIQHYYPRDLDLFVQPVRGYARINQSGRIEIVDNGVYVDPENWNDARFQREMRRVVDPRFGALQYMLDTSVRGDDRFDMNMVRYMAREDMPPMTLYLGLDPASGTGTSHPGLGLVGIDADRRLYVLGSWGGFSREAEFVEMAFDISQEEGVEAWGVEMYGSIGHTTRQNIEEIAEERGTYPMIEELTGGGKETRIRQVLLTRYQRGRVIHAHELRGGEYEKQLASFPFSKDTDELDAVCRAAEVALKYGYVGEDANAVEETRGPVPAVIADVPVGYKLSEITPGSYEEMLQNENTWAAW